jgi:hypothetical protein
LAVDRWVQVPVLDFNMVQSLCHLLSGLLTPGTIPAACTDKINFELFFCFAAVPLPAASMDR